VGAGEVAHIQETFPNAHSKTNIIGSIVKRAIKHNPISLPSQPALQRARKRYKFEEFFPLPTLRLLNQNEITRLNKSTRDKYWD